MEFRLSEETKLLKDNAGRFLQDRCSSAFLRESVRGETGFSTALWKEMAGLGWLGLIYEERYGGVGGSFFDLCILFEEMGKVLLPTPFFCSAVLSGLLIDEAASETVKKELLPPMIGGERILTLALLDEGGRCDFSDLKMEARKGGDGSFVLTGKRILVPYAHAADEILVCAQIAGPGQNGPTVFRTTGRSQGVKIVSLDTPLTGEKLFAVFYEEAPLSRDDILGVPGRGIDYIEKVLPRAIICKCAEMVGGLARVVEMTVGYVKERRQFGRPLGALQAVQHSCADMQMHLEASRLVTYQAASLLSEGMPCEKEIAMAKAFCSDAYKKCTWSAHQIHGGIGFTEEHDLHFYYKHAKASELAFGDARFHRGRVGEAMGL